MALPAAILAMVPSLIKTSIEIVDRKFQSEGEREAAKALWQADAEAKLQSAWDEEQRQVTLRHAADMSSDSWLSKNIRPMVLCYLMGLFTLAFFMKVDTEVLIMLKGLLLTVFGFYFSARTLDKAIGIFAPKKV